MALFKKILVVIGSILFVTEHIHSGKDSGQKLQLIMEKNKTLGLKLSLPYVDQKPISDTVSTEIIMDEILNNPEKILGENSKMKYELGDIDSESVINVDEKLNNRPLKLFDACNCMAQENYISFAKQVIEKAVILYKQKEINKPFVYGSFASGGLFPDLCLLTRLVHQLRKENVKDVYLRVNLVDTDLRDYIFQHSGGLDRTVIKKDSVHSHMLFFKPTSTIEFSNANDISELIINFLQWFTKNLNIKMDLFVYGIGQDYVYDHENKRAPSHDMLIAMDYYPVSQGDLGQLAIRTIKKGGYLCSLNNKSPEDILAYDGLVPLPDKEIAEVDKKDEQEDTISSIGSFESYSSNDDAYSIDIVLSEKAADMQAETFKALLKQARGDDRKIGRLFDPLFYPESKILNYQSTKLQKSLKFNPLDYFEIVYKDSRHDFEKDLFKDNKVLLEQALELAASL